MTDARRLMACCGSNVTVKVRHYVQHAGLTWEIDEYDGLLKGVILAEVELSAVDQQIGLAGLDRAGGHVGASLSQDQHAAGASRQLEEDAPGLEPVL